MKSRTPRLMIVTVILTMSLYSLPTQLLQTAHTVQLEQAPAVDFNFRPKFVVMGELVNFTATILSGGQPPFSYSWDFDDTQTGINQSVLHRFSSPRTYLVSVNVTDSLNASTVVTKSVVVNEWPIIRYGWNIKWNITPATGGFGYTDGINVWNVTFQNLPVIRDARIAHIVVTYKPGLGCVIFYDQPPAYGFPSMENTKNSGMIYYEDSPGSPDPYFQLRAKYDVGGYNYTQVFRFYQSGRWEPELLIGRSGCVGDHLYNPQVRVDLAVLDDGNDFASVYTSSGTWQDLLWEGAYTDNGFRDLAHNGSQWRVGDQRKYYYMVPHVLQADTDLPVLPSRILLVRARSNEIESASCSISFCGSTLQFVNGELAFRRNIVIWFTPFVWDHGPDSILPSTNKVVNLSFFP